MMKHTFLLGTLILMCQISLGQKLKFNDGWRFRVDTSLNFSEEKLSQQKWTSVTLPHDWSIDLPFNVNSPGGNSAAGLPGGLGMYEKEFYLDEANKGKNVYIIFDGVYMNSSVWINDHLLGTRPYGYISFEYNLTPFLKFGDEKNVIKVRAENKIPNSRWYSGSGIYRNVWIDKRDIVSVENWGTYITTPEVQKERAVVNIETSLQATDRVKDLALKTTIYSPEGKAVKSGSMLLPEFLGRQVLHQSFDLPNPELWDTDHPALYRAVSEVIADGQVMHSYTTRFGIRTFYFDREKGFFLNGKNVKIIGANMHHDLGALGAAVNVSAMKRQLTLLKDMGLNGIRTSHNPPAPEWLDLCDEMGFLVMDEAFDVWTWPMESTPYNYNLYFDDWHEKDLSDMIVRDRNHPSVILWSIGNEIPEQWGGPKDTAGRVIARALSKTVKKYDTTRPVTSGMNGVDEWNNIFLSGALDVSGANYHDQQWKDLGTKIFPGIPTIISENTSAIATRGHYDMPSDSIRRWAGFKSGEGNKDFTVSAYENASVPWGTTNEEALKLIFKYLFLSGMYLWTGFDYLGEPTPYPFPARSSYFGIIDLAGFPKDSYYLYKSLLSKETVLHVLPHWNWTKGQKIDVHIYFNNADEVELYLNGKRIGRKSKTSEDLFVRFNGITFQPGTLKAISKLKGKKVAEKIIKTAGKPFKVVAESDKKVVSSDGEDLSFVKVTIVDKDGVVVPDADNLLHFDIRGSGTIAALDNGYQADLEPYGNKESRKAYNGLALAIVRPTLEDREIVLKISGEGLMPAEVRIKEKE